MAHQGPERIKLDHAFFMEEAERIARASTCAKIQVGTVIVKDRHIVSHGYNGTVAGDKHCCDHFSGRRSRDKLGESEFLKQHAAFSEQRELHSESNALMFALRNSSSVVGATLYTTHSPCFSCAKLIIQAGVYQVVYKSVYDDRTLKFLRRNGVHLLALA